jgi:hypothetical protein
MSEGKYGIRKDIKALYGPKASAEYLRDVAKSRATPNLKGKDRAQRLIKSSDKPPIIRGDYGDKNLRYERYTTPADKRNAERRLRTIQKKAAGKYTRKVAKEAAETAAKTLKNLSKATKATGIGMAIELGTETLKSKNLQNKISKSRKEIRLQNAKKG